MILQIKEIMRSRRITGAALAARLGVSAQTVSTYYNNDNIKLSTLRRIAAALDVPITALFADDDTSAAAAADGVVSADGSHAANLTTTAAPDTRCTCSAGCPWCNKPIDISLSLSPRLE